MMIENKTNHIPFLQFHRTFKKFHMHFDKFILKFQIEKETGNQNEYTHTPPTHEQGNMSKHSNLIYIYQRASKNK